MDFTDAAQRLAVKSPPCRVQEMVNVLADLVHPTLDLLCPVCQISLLYLDLRDVGSFMWT